MSRIKTERFFLTLLETYFVGGGGRGGAGSGVPVENNYFIYEASNKKSSSSLLKYYSVTASCFWMFPICRVQFLDRDSINLFKSRPYLRKEKIKI
jgi:hypothetical protein